jgi:DNA-binding NarL/FixJ family response regulator
VRILIADDHIAVRSALGYVLKEKLDDTVIADATNLSELFAASFNQQPDLVLLDWELSGLPSAATMSLPNGDPKRRRSDLRRNVVVLSLHNLESHPSVIALSSHPEARLAALTGGADAFILKGGPPRELFGILRSFSRSSK